MNTQESNKLIAEFMGLRYGRSSFRTYVIENNSEVLIKDLKYHSSWNWLMPVIKNINVLPFDKYEGIEFIEKIHKKVLLVNIIDAHKTVVEFIQWYNQQNTTK